MIATVRYIVTWGNAKVTTPTDVDYFDCSETSGNFGDPVPKQVIPLNALPPKKKPGTTRFVVISDTHELHHKINLPPGDVLLHCGDILISDSLSPRFWSWWRIQAFFKWFADQKGFSHKVIIAGNHDAILERLGAEEVRRLLIPKDCKDTMTYLCEDAAKVAGYTIFGTPRSKGKSHNKAFQSKEAWSRTPFSPSGNSSNTQSSPSLAQQEKAPLVTSQKNSSSRQDLSPFGSKENPIDILVSHQPAHLPAMKQWGDQLEITTAHFCGHDHPGHGLRYYLGAKDEEGEGRAEGRGDSSPSIPSFNAAMMRGKFCKERLQNVTVVDLPPPPVHRPKL